MSGNVTGNGKTMTATANYLNLTKAMAKTKSERRRDGDKSHNSPKNKKINNRKITSIGEKSISRV